ncbi:MAG: SRPBCC family protein [Pseudomonadales bacterium]
MSKKEQLAPGEARCHGRTYAELLSRETREIPDVIATDRYRFLGDEDLPVERYIGKEFFQREVDKMWSKVWQMVCREEDIPNVGDYIVYELFDWSFIIMRSAEDQIKAFYNSCLHRARKLKTADGSGRHLTCPFHGYSWNIDGSIREIPCEWDVPHLVNADMQLPEAKLDTWAGFVFINLDDDCQSLDEFLAPYPEVFQRWRLEECVKVVHVVKEVQANWKIVSEAFMESYHARQTHAQILPFSADTNARYDILGDHTNLSITPMAEPSPHMYEAGNLPSEQEVLDTLLSDSGRVTGEAKLMVPEGENARSFMAEMSRKTYAEEDGHDYSHATDAEMLDAMVFNVFPNFSPWGGFPPNVIYRWRPNGWDVDSTIMEVMILKRSPKDGPRDAPCAPHYLDADQPWAAAEELDALGPIFDQDMNNLPHVQKGMKASRKGSVSLANYQEVRVRHFHQVLDKYLNS